MIGHWLNRQTTTLTQQPDPVAAKVDQPGASEGGTGASTAGEHTHDIYFLPESDVRRLDELRDPVTGESWQVREVVRPSSTRYRKALSLLYQTEGEPHG